MYQPADDQNLILVHKSLGLFVSTLKFLKGHHQVLRGEQVDSHRHVTKFVVHDTLTKFKTSFMISKNGRLKGLTSSLVSLTYRV